MTLRFNPRNTSIFIFALSFISSFQSLAQDYSLDATYGDVSLVSGFEQDPYRVEISAGGSIDASTLATGCIGMIADAPDLQLTYESGEYPLYISAASAEDTSIVINIPNGKWVCDDDSGGDLNPSVIFDEPAEGTYDIWLGTVGSEALADTSLFISEIGNSSEFDLDIYNPDINFSPEYSGQLYQGSLEYGDDTRDTGAWQDIYSFEGQAGESAVIDLRSAAIDTFLIVHTPSGQKFVNDDYDGSTSRSLLSINLNESGQYNVLVSSYSTEESGAYTLGIDSAVASVNNDLFSGSLSSSDDTRANGQYLDTYEFSGSTGQSVEIDLRSDEFDTIVIMESPSGEVLENDDTDRVGHSVINAELNETGQYFVYVTSYEAGVIGSYDLSISEGAQSSSSNSGNSGNSSSSNRDTIELALGQERNGALQSGDALGSESQFQDYFSFNGSAGEAVRISMTSSEVDTYLTLVMPDGRELENDDHEGSTELSVIELRLPEAGRYSIIASSYRDGEAGDYKISAMPSSGNITAGSGMFGSRVYGIFVGISDYSELRQTQPGWGDLSFTADDAIVARDALTQSAGMSITDSVTLLDTEATIENVRTAFQEMGRKITANDTFVFFYSGHGGQELRAAGPNSFDADGYDETLALSNGTITDDEITAMFDQIGANTSLIILDSCYSGGFAKDVVSKPGRMGLFSSDEDVPSLVASKFTAGGYLSHFFSEAIEGGNADSDNDSAINAMELSQYLHMRYNAESLNKGPSSFNTPDFGYQHLVADRGGVSHDAILFTVR